METKILIVWAIRLSGILALSTNGYSINFIQICPRRILEDDPLKTVQWLVWEWRSIKGFYEKQKEANEVKNYHFQSLKFSPSSFLVTSEPKF